MFGVDTVASIAEGTSSIGIRDTFGKSWFAPIDLSGEKNFPHEIRLWGR